ncbi:sugar-binding transcriptional regulator [Listeria fleischmannii]|uniref:sugar-binding transcriptional regulator n=1 Tax=Listeria fleischmannii TaxID=1069827 RepID=UPI0016296A74|nr:sugar-binding transcriptional regulator [Listeria fleischmannii]MBC1417926.1 sugar-binding transcriptional regulator [Listeria fleischmannii]
MGNEKLDLLRQVAYKYYVEEKNQETIGRELNIYRTSVSRMLKQAKQTGVVEIKIHDFDEQLYELETELRDTFNLKYVRIARTEPHFSTQEKEENLAKTASLVIKNMVRPHETIGVAWGETLGNAISHIENRRKTMATFIPIVGGPSHVHSKYHVNTLVYELARKFGGNSVFVNATVVQETEQLKNGIMSSHYFQELKSKWDKLDVAIVGIGGLLSEKTSKWRDFLSPEDYEDLRLREACGDSCCNFFDRDGKVLHGSLYNRTIGIGLENLERVPTVLGVARSKRKSRAILAMLKKGYINALVTDDETAKLILKYAKS